ncbi:MAG: hypothetical protein AVDCRST_MAG79-1776, partial [uncultured Thermoleophilia bacterium]
MSGTTTLIRSAGILGAVALALVAPRFGEPAVAAAAPKAADRR